MPEIGLEEDPISPVIRDDTVTKRNENSTIRTAPKGFMWSWGTQGSRSCKGEVAQMATTNPIEPTPTIQSGKSRSVRRTAPDPRPELRDKSRRAEPAELAAEQGLEKG